MTSSDWWYSRIELEPDVWSRDEIAYTSMAPTRMAMRRTNVQGRKILDIGAVDGMVSTLLKRMGAGRVVAVDVADYRQRINTVQAAYGVDFEYIPRVGSLSLIDRMLDLWKFGDRKFTTDARAGHDKDFGFDVIICSGVMYHIHSPLHLIGALRTLVRPGGIVILETAIVPDESFTQIFNYFRTGHYIYAESDTWFLSPRLLDYLLRSLGLRPLDFIYRDQKTITDDGGQVGRGVVVCRAEAEPIAHAREIQMQEAALNFEYDALWRRELEHLKAPAPVPYTPGEVIMDGPIVDLLEMALAQRGEPLAPELSELRLEDWE